MSWSTPGWVRRPSGRCEPSFSMTKRPVGVYIHAVLHGYQALTSVTDFCYKIDGLQGPDEDVHVRYDDPISPLKLAAPISIVSARDRAGMPWMDYVGCSVTRQISKQVCDLQAATSSPLPGPKRERSLNVYPVGPVAGREQGVWPI